jgi:hypothetical protein
MPHSAATARTYHLARLGEMKKLFGSGRLIRVE